MVFARCLVQLHSCIGFVAEDEFIEEFDRLLARDDEVNKRQKLRDTIQTFLKFRRNSNANASSKSSSPSRRPPATSASPSSHSATSAASIPAAAVAAGDAEASSKMSIVVCPLPLFSSTSKDTFSLDKGGTPHRRRHRRRTRLRTSRSASGDQGCDNAERVRGRGCERWGHSWRGHLVCNRQRQEAVPACRRAAHPESSLIHGK